MPTILIILFADLLNLGSRLGDRAIKPDRSKNLRRKLTGQQMEMEARIPGSRRLVKKNPASSRPDGWNQGSSPNLTDN